MRHETLVGLMQPGDGAGLLDDLRPPDWMAHAGCRGEDVSRFVPAHRMAGDQVPRRLGEVCARCPVAPHCLVYALERPELQGCWGGTTDAQRKALRRSLAA